MTIITIASSSPSRVGMHCLGMSRIFFHHIIDPPQFSLATSIICHSKSLNDIPYVNIIICIHIHIPYPMISLYIYIPVYHLPFNFSGAEALLGIEPRSPSHASASAARGSSQRNACPRGDPQRWKKMIVALWNHPQHFKWGSFCWGVSNRKREITSLGYKAFIRIVHCNIL